MTAAPRLSIDSSSDSGRPWWGAAWLAVLAFAIALRVAGISFGYPHSFHPDEGFMARMAAHAVTLAGDPSTPPYTSWVAYPPSLANQIALVSLLLPDDVEPKLFLVGRWIVLFWAIVGMICVTLCARALGGRPGAFLAAAHCGFSPLLVEQSRYCTTDTPTGAGVALTCWLAIRLQQRPTWRRYLLAGAAVGLAASYKYMGAMGALLVVGAHLTSQRPFRARQLGRLVAAGLISIAVFILLNFEILRSWTEFWAETARMHQIYTTGHPGFTSDRNWIHAPRYLLSYVVGWPAAIAMAVAVPWLWVRHRTPRVLSAAGVASVATLHLAYLSSLPVFIARNQVHTGLLWSIAFGAIAGLAMAALPVRRARFLLVLLVLGLLPHAVLSSRQSWIMTRPDTRTEAAHWLRAHAEAGAKVAIMGDSGKGAYMPPSEVSKIELHAEQYDDCNVLRARGYQYLLTSTAKVSRYLKSPAEFPREARRVQRGMRRVEQTCELLADFSRPPAPGAELFGSTVDFLHNPGIQVWRVSLNADFDRAVVFADGFESGDPSQWSNAVP